MKSVNHLSQEHKIVLQALTILDAMSLRVEEGGSPDEADVQALLDFLRCFADDHHQGKEECVLFPELMKTSVQTESVQHMTFEHDQERSLVMGLEDALRTRDRKDFIYYANRLNSLLRNHLYKEDHLLFETVKESLSVEQDERVLSKMEDIDKRVEEKMGRALGSLRKLELKYLGRSSVFGHQPGGVGRDAARSETR
jgi:hemerythrin-like domain-containing protein